MLDTISKKFDDNKSILLFCVMVTFCWGMVTHAYMFLNFSLSHDSLTEFVQIGHYGLWKVQLGRYLAPVYYALTRNLILLPWLIGVLTMLWLSFAVFLTARLFEIKSKLVLALISGSFVANLTVTATAATYMNDLDNHIFSLLMAVSAVYLWRRYEKGYLAGILFVFISLGVYQAFISVVVTLIILSSIMSLLNHERPENVIRRGLKGLGMLILGGILYYIGMKIATAIAGTEILSGEYNAPEPHAESFVQLLKFTVKGYCVAIWRMFNLPLAFGKYGGLLLNVIVHGIFACSFVQVFFSREYSARAKWLILVLALAFPMATVIIYPATGFVHYIMTFAVYLIYLFELLFFSWCLQKKIFSNSRLLQRFALVVFSLIFIILLGNIKVANALYTKKKIEFDSSKNFYNRVLYKIESLENYEPGKTPVVFAGRAEQLNRAIPGFEQYNCITGAEKSNMVGLYRSRPYKALFNYAFNNPMRTVDQETWDRIIRLPVVKKMPAYPKKGCIKMVENILVVKLGPPR